MNFTPLSNDIINMKMSDGAFRLYCLLESYCFGEKRECYPSQKTLAEKLRKSVRTIQRYITELVELGLIKVRRRGSTSNLYEVLGKISLKAAQVCAKTAKSIDEKCTSFKKKSNSTFNNFQQRNYDMDKLEALLLQRDSSLSYEDCLISR